MNLSHKITAINIHLEQSVDSLEDSKVKEALKYSLLSGGKRLRPVMLLSLLEDLGVNMSIGMDAACALECIHAYSLVHDDLPALDNDDLRRGKPTNHKVYGEDFAILAGDALLTFAFQLVSDCDNAKDCVGILAKQAGSNGMILGQELDILDDIHTLEELLKCYELKTGCLFNASLEMAVVLAQRNDLRPFASKLGRNLGIAFQIQDDLLEVTQSSEIIGKSVQSDLIRNKKTILSFMSLDKAQLYLDDLFKTIFDLMHDNHLSNQSLYELVKTIDKRIM
ncbi:hypothetical protein AOC36_04885 [Erysipelothrix larvae]|uniref:Farnesyl diphosphate synthase n=1 Tax=Erysipelothrix larvae TaxID=1514105 RepID=A0A120JTM5_9FIRM|nr:polyprenyl synthetase family protein [Erysipelothrix larvae]AMC93333.1 hypothetical protein AOC36_04885 [Erysipelothrix larvae]